LTNLTTPATAASAIVIILFSIEYIDENRGADEGEPIFGSGIVREHDMVGVTQSATFIFPSGPEFSDLGILITRIPLDWGEVIWVAHDEGDAAALAGRSTAATHDTKAANARVGTETILLRSTAVKYVKLWNENAPIADILRTPNNFATRVFCLQVGFVAAASCARLSLLVRRNDILVTIFLCKPLGQEISLDCAPIEILSRNYGFRNGGGVLDVFHLTTSRGPAAVASHTEGGLLVDPCLLLVFMRIPTVVVIGFAQYPVYRRLAAAGATTLAGGLGNDNLLRLADAIHGHGAGRF